MIFAIYALHIWQCQLLGNLVTNKCCINLAVTKAYCSNEYYSCPWFPVAVAVPFSLDHNRDVVWHTVIYHFPRWIILPWGDASPCSHEDPLSCALSLQENELSPIRNLLSCHQMTPQVWTLLSAFIWPLDWKPVGNWKHISAVPPTILHLSSSAPHHWSICLKHQRYEKHWARYLAAQRWPHEVT